MKYLYGSEDEHWIVKVFFVVLMSAAIAVAMIKASHAIDQDAKTTQAVATTDKAITGATITNTPVTTVVIGPGELSWKNGALEFKGKADESAQAMFQFLKQYIDTYIAAGCKSQ